MEKIFLYKGMIEYDLGYEERRDVVKRIVVAESPEEVSTKYVNSTKRSPLISPQITELTEGKDQGLTLEFRLNILGEAFGKDNVIR